MHVCASQVGLIVGAALLLAACPDPGPGSGARGERTATGEGGPPTLEVTVAATFSDLPEGAVVVAPSARDRDYQKVTRSEHRIEAVGGQVRTSDDGRNMFFVSEPLPEAIDEVRYEGVFHVVRRVGMAGSVEGVRAARFDREPDADGQPEPSEAIRRVAGEIRGGEPAGPPVAELRAVLGLMKGWELKPDGPSEPDAVVDAGEGTALGIARATVGLARARGLVAEVIQGVRFEDVPSTLDEPHAWLQVKLPRLDWTPVDPLLLARSGDMKGPLYLGKLPSDRLDLAYGAEVVFPPMGEGPELRLEGSLAAPFAVKDGERVGQVSWTVKIAEHVEDEQE